MRLRLCVLFLLLAGSPALAQQGLCRRDTSRGRVPGRAGGPGASPLWSSPAVPEREGPLASNRHFPNFIGFMSNPLQNIDPRSLTQIVPIFASAWVSPSRALPDLDMQVYGPALSVALTDRLGIGLNQGGLAFAHIDRNDRRGPLLDRLRANRGQEFGGTRQGFLNVGTYAQYTFIEDVENQFLATAGVRVVIPCGSYDLFQGRGPAQMAPYLTVGKELGCFHFLATTGYQFLLRSGDRSFDVFYFNAHLDYQILDWIYPLVEANLSYHTVSVDPTLPTRQGYINLGNFESTGNTLTLAAGVNLVLIRDRLEFGAVYVRSLATQNNLDVDAVIVKLVLRF